MSQNKGASTLRRQCSRVMAIALGQGNSQGTHAQQQQQQAQQEHTNYLASLAMEWEENARANDPDYDLKEDLIDARDQALRRELGSNGQLYTAQTPEALRELAETAYNQVNEKYNATFGSRKPMKTASGGKLGGSPAPEPQSLQEAIAAAMGNS